MRQENRMESVPERVVQNKTGNHREEIRSGAGLGRDCVILTRPACRDQDIVLSKWIGLEGTVQLVRKHYEKLRGRFPLRMLEEAAGFDRYLSVIPEAATAMKSGVCGMHEVSRGGIFAGLWDMAQEAGVGLKVNLREIPVRQETIEICEFFGENPYELLSGGCLLMTAEDGDALVDALAREGIPAVMIGRTTKGNDRLLFNEGRKRYLDKPRYTINYHIGGEGE